MPMRKDRPVLYEMTGVWLDAVERGAGLFEPEARVWTPAAIGGLVDRIWVVGDHGAGGFQRKLLGQARAAGPAGQRLAAEAMFVFFLKDASGLPATKRGIVRDLLDGLDGVTVPDRLDEAFDFGLVRYGAGRARSLYDYLYVLRFSEAWAATNASTRLDLRTDAWAFREFAGAVEHHNATFAMEAIKHLVHPDVFESVASRSAKRDILRRLGGGKVNRSTDQDEELLALRRRMTEEGQPEGFSFYDAAVRPLWDSAKTDKATEDVDETDADTANGDGGSPAFAGPRRSLTLADLRAETDGAGLRLDDRVLAGLVAALTSGKHVVLTGAPGTAKTTLAELVAKVAARAGLCDGHVLATATADWSTYETVGGYQPREDGTLRFVPGVVLAAIRDRRWLVLDEMNRANTDRALGPLFTVLAGQSVVLPQQEDGRPVRIRVAADDGQGGADGVYTDYAVPEDWRIVATTNVLDRSLLYDLSFALMRRFAFVDVPAPSEEVYLELIRDAVADDSDVAVTRRVERVVGGLVRLVRQRPLGPALFADAARHAASYAQLAPEATDGEIAFDAFLAYLLPQFEGVDEDAAVCLAATMGRLVGPAGRDRLRSTLRQSLGVRLVDPRHGAEEEDNEEDEDDEPDLA